MVTLARWLAADCLKSATQRECAKSSCTCGRVRSGAVGGGLAWREWP